ncbi:MAG: hypothetical protein ABMB14_09615 [Myxococcota bacterium]
MALALAFELRLEERGENRVVVSVLLAPTGDAAVLDGVALQLVSRTGEPLGVQMVLPIAGELTHPMLSTVELRRAEPIPLGSKVVGTAWRGPEQRDATLPTDPFTELEVHMRARRRIVPAVTDAELERLVPEDRALIARDFPWIDEPRMITGVAELTVVDHEEPEEILDDLVSDLGLDAASEEWLRDLLDED